MGQGKGREKDDDLSRGMAVGVRRRQPGRYGFERKSGALLLSGPC